MAAEEYPEKFTHKELVELGRDWLIKPYAAMAPYGHTGCPVVITEISAATYGGEKPDVLGFCQKKTILIECKVSRSDFLADKKKPFRDERISDMALGCQRWYMSPMGVIKYEDVPEKWGLLHVTQGRHILPIKKPELINKDYHSEINILISVMRRLNIQKDDHVAIKRYEEFKNMPKSKKQAEFYIKGENEGVKYD